MKHTLYVFGAGHGAGESLEDMESIDKYNNFVFIVDEPKVDQININDKLSDVISLDTFKEMLSINVPYDFNAIITPVDIAYKKKIYCLFPYIAWNDCISKAALILSSDVGIGFNARAFTFVGTTARIGDFVKVNFQTLIGYSVNIGDYTFISHHVGIGANVTIGNDCYIYEGTTIIPGITIGDNTVIGAGSLVTKDVESNVVAYGSPAKLVRANV
jgi:acetyltransferase-like isoleucine patch superfamily enzyme